MSTGRLPSVDGGIQPTIVDAKGDLIVATAADTVSRLAVGSNDQVLTADSSTSTGLKWAAASSGGANWSLLNSGGTALTGAQTITVSGISGKNQILVLVSGASSANASSYISLRVNTDTGANYYYYGIVNIPSSTYSVDMFDNSGAEGDDKFAIGRMGDGAGATVQGYALISGCNASGVKTIQSAGGASKGINGTQRQYVVGGYYNSSSTVSSVSLYSSTGNFDAGYVYVYTTA